MLQPLAIVFYERIMPGSQLLNRLQDLKYRVLAVDNAARLAATVQQETPMILLADLDAKSDICAAIATLKQTPETSHVPIIAYAPDNATQLIAAGQKAGANMTVGESAISSYLTQLLDQALQIE